MPLNKYHLESNNKFNKMDSMGGKVRKNPPDI